MTASCEFQLGDRALFESEQGAVVIVTIAAVTQWLEGFQPPVEYIVFDECATLLHGIRPDRLQPLRAQTGRGRQ